jgi:hypothetical protein
VALQHIGGGGGGVISGHDIHHIHGAWHAWLGRRGVRSPSSLRGGRGSATTSPKPLSPRASLRQRQAHARRLAQLVSDELRCAIASGLRMPYGCGWRSWDRKNVES